MRGCASSFESGTVVISFILELWEFLRSHKKFWLLPLFIMMALLGVFIVLAQGSAIAPFIYTLF